MMVLNGGEGLKSEVYVDRISLEHVSEFKYLRCVLIELGTDGAEYSRKMASGGRVIIIIWRYFAAGSTPGTISLRKTKPR